MLRRPNVCVHNRKLPTQFQAKLNLPGRASLVDLSEVGIADRAVGIQELRVIPGVEELRAELKLQRFPDGGALFDGKVPVVQTRAGENVGTGIAKETRRRRSKARGVKPVQAIGPEMGVLHFGSSIA